MTRKKLIAAILFCASLLALCLTVACQMTRERQEEPTLPDTNPSQTAGSSAETTPSQTEPSTETTSPSTSAPETTVPETTVPETTAPQPEVFTLTFVGDCTLGSMPDRMANSNSFVGTIGTDYSLPFRNVSQYFSTDDCTFINLEGVFANEGTPADKMFVFRGPTAYGQILTLGSVELVTLSNNHTYDFGVEGYRSTKNVLDAQGTTYVETNSTALYTTESGLTVGVYAVYFTLNQSDLAEDIAYLKDQGAEVIVAAVHWGDEGTYNPNASQQSIAKTLIDNGVDIVWGHHPHVLQKIESYNGGIIYYSLGNFSFGGNHDPYDYDTAVLQQKIIRDPEGNISLGELEIIPCSVSSVSSRNDFQPTPYEVGSEGYNRVMTKLNGTYQGADIDLSYRDQYTKPTETTAPATTAPATTAPTHPETTVPVTTAPTQPATSPTEPIVPTEPTEPTVPTEPSETETSVPETTVPETTISETTVPETTVPETTVPETTVPETTVPETTIPETTVPETTIPQTSEPANA